MCYNNFRYEEIIAFTVIIILYGLSVAQWYPLSRIHVHTLIHQVLRRPWGILKER